ncbi:hypothetical protein [Parasulfitobacter algicola]|nr:hypothetical protein [Sulfitobacter algicola]
MLIAQQDKVALKTFLIQLAGLAVLVIFIAVIFERLLNVPLP